MKIKDLVNALNRKEYWEFVVTQDERIMNDKAGEGKVLADLTEDVLNKEFLKFDIWTDDGNPFVKPALFILIK